MPITLQVHTGLQSFSLFNDDSNIIDRRSQRTAFPPNYVHSLDSAHMMMTAMACSQENIAFAGRSTLSCLVDISAMPS